MARAAVLAARAPPDVKALCCSLLKKASASADEMPLESAYLQEESGRSAWSSQGRFASTLEAEWCGRRKGAASKGAEHRKEQRARVLSIARSSEQGC